MPTWLEIASGPVLYFAMTILLLGLARQVLLTLWGLVEAIRRAGDRNIPYTQVVKDTLSWLVPISHLHRTRPVYSWASFLLHLGIIFTGLFLGNHIDILRSTWGLAWPAIPRHILDGLALLSIIAAAYLLAYRLYVRSSRTLSKFMDYLLLLIILNLFVSGYLAGRQWNPIPYDDLMLFHAINGIVLLILIPFTKIAHCVLFPLVRLCSEVAWHLTPQGGSEVVRTLYGDEGRPI
jgi:nitrate reductase gamma subunit